MHNFRLRAVLSLAGAALAIMATRGLAQEQTTATYDDWTVRCVTRAGTPPRKLCDMEQLSQLNGKEKPFSRVVISRPAKGQPARLIVQVPANVWLASGVRIQIGGKDAGLAGPFTRCLPGGCFAAIALKDATVGQFLKATAPARIIYANAAKGEVGIPLSFKGFGQAFDALQKE